MNITLEEILEVNKRFGGQLVNNSSLDFALSFLQENKSKYKSCAMLVRAIVVDHPFSDANKRTALYTIEKVVGVKNVEKMTITIITIARENVIDIDKIIEMLKNANR